MQTPKLLPPCIAFAVSMIAASAIAAPPGNQTDSMHEGVIRATVTYSFTKLDRNQDGGLSRSEVPRDMVDLRLDFQRADFTGDGKLSPVECAMYADGKVPQYSGASHTWNVVFGPPQQRDALIADR